MTRDGQTMRDYGSHYPPKYPWKAYGPCGKCNAAAGLPCMHLALGTVIINAHAGRELRIPSMKEEFDTWQGEEAFGTTTSMRYHARCVVPACRSLDKKNDTWSSRYRTMWMNNHRKQHVELAQEVDLLGMLGDENEVDQFRRTSDK